MCITGKDGNFSFLLSLSLFTVVHHAKAQATNTPTDQYQYANFSSSMAIIIVVLISALLLMVLFSIYIRQRPESRNRSARPVTGGQSVGRRANRGLAPDVIETFPTFAYSAVKGLKIGKGALECAVCLNEFEDEDTLRLLPKCDHVFHPECIDAWLSSHTTCPVCRANLATTSDEYPATSAIIIPPVEIDDGSSNESTNTNELPNSVSIRTADDQINENQIQQVAVPVTIYPSRSMNQNRIAKSRSIKSLFFSKFPRSHSTGHSLVQPGENVDRFTLRLPEVIRKQIMNQKLNRTTSLLLLPRETSSKRGYRTGEGSSRGKSYMRFESLDRVGKSDRWAFSMVPPFLARAPSVRYPKMENDDGEGTSSMAARGFITSLKKSFSRLNSKVSEPGLVSMDSAKCPV